MSTSKFIAFGLGVSLAIAAAITLGTAVYLGRTTSTDYANIGTAVALILFIVGATLWGPVSFAHGDHLDERGARPTPAGSDLRNRARGIVVMLAAVVWLFIVIAIDQLL